MNPTLTMKMLTLVGGITLLGCAFWFSRRAIYSFPLTTKVQDRDGCSDGAGIKAAIDTLSRSDQAKAKKATDTLLRYSEGSAACRARSSHY